MPCWVSCDSGQCTDMRCTSICPIPLLKQSQLYALLAKLEQQGYVTPTLELQDTRPPRKMFQLTPSGHRAFLAWVQEPVSQGRGMRMEFLAKLYSASREEPELAMRLIERQRVACCGWLVHQQQDAEAAHETCPFSWLVHRFRLSQIEAMLTWLDECQAGVSVAVT
jgi:PadR family transcriptional regulator AphA